MKSKCVIIPIALILMGVLPCHAQKQYNSYKGLVMAGYQGWFNAHGDDENRGWYHYNGRNGFRPGSCSIDLWPDVSEYEKTYESEFTFEDGSHARLFSQADYSTVDTHFRWMKEYGLDGVFMQRFVVEIARESGRKHFDKVLDHAMKAAAEYERAICIMYDLSGMGPAGAELLLEDIDELAERYKLFDHSANPSYLFHNGRPLITVWGVGFNDRRRYGLDEGKKIVAGLKTKGFSVMLGIPAYWREFGPDTVNDPELHRLICECDIIMPWFVGRYNESRYKRFCKNIDQDIQWAEEHGVDYAPLCFPGFSWENMIYPRTGSTIPRNSGSFFKMQLDYCLAAGAKMLYIAMFDEIDEGTAIFKLAKKIPVPYPGSTFVPLDEDVDGDLYLRLAGQAAKSLK